MLFGYRPLMAVMRGVVTRLEGGKPHVEVPDLGVGYAFGPLEVATSDPVAKGDRVFVAQVGDTPEDVAVVGLIDPPPASSVPGGPAGGDLTGTYPNPGVSAARIQAVGDARYSLLAHTHDDRYFTEAEADARFAPVSHSHPFTQVTGTIAESQLLARLSQASLDARYAAAGAPPAAHTHDDRYFTEAEADARFPLRTRLASVGASPTWLRVATVNGSNAANGSHVTLLVSGQGDFGQATRVWDVVTLGQRGDNAYTFEGARRGANTVPWVWYVKQVSTYVFELWARRSAFDDAASVQVLSQGGGIGTGLNLDSATTVDPGAALTTLFQPANDNERVTRVVHGSTAGAARPAAVFVEWLGSVLPTNMGVNDTWVNTAL